MYKHFDPENYIYFSKLNRKYTKIKFYSLLIIIRWVYLMNEQLFLAKEIINNSSEDISNTEFIKTRRIQALNNLDM